jgi:chitosanase
MRDGDPNRRLQVTLGIQFDEAGDLPKLLKSYCAENGRCAMQVLPYLPKVNTGNNTATVLSQARGFHDLLRNAGTDQVMQRLQIELFKATSWDPALRWVQAKGFCFPLSLLIVADSFLQSNQMRPALVQRVRTALPVTSRVDEKNWITDYTNARHAWLRAAGGAMATSSYRTDCYLRLIAKGDWELTSDVVMNGNRIRLTETLAS